MRKNEESLDRDGTVEERESYLYEECCVRMLVLSILEITVPVPNLSCVLFLACVLVLSDHVAS